MSYLCMHLYPCVPPCLEFLLRELVERFLQIKSIHVLQRKMMAKFCFYWWFGRCSVWRFASQEEFTLWRKGTQSLRNSINRLDNYVRTQSVYKNPHNQFLLYFKSIQFLNQIWVQQEHWNHCTHYMANKGSTGFCRKVTVQQCLGHSYSTTTACLHQLVKCKISVTLWIKQTWFPYLHRD